MAFRVGNVLIWGARMVKWLQIWNLLLSCEAPLSSWCHLQYNILLTSTTVTIFCPSQFQSAHNGGMTFVAPHKICEKTEAKRLTKFLPIRRRLDFSGAQESSHQDDIRFFRFRNRNLNRYIYLPLLLGGRFKVSNMIQDDKDALFDKSTKVVWQWWRCEIKIWADRTVKHCSQLFNCVYYCWVRRRVEERGVPESYKYKTTKENHRRFTILSPSNCWSILVFTAALGDSRNAAVWSVCRFMSFHPNINIKKSHWNAIRKMWLRFLTVYLLPGAASPHTKNPPTRSAPAERRHFGYRWSMSRWAPASCPRRTPPRQHQPAGRHGVIPFIALGVISWQFQYETSWVLNLAIAQCR